MRLFKVNPETFQMYSFGDIDRLSDADKMRDDDRSTQEAGTGNHACRLGRELAQ